MARGDMITNADGTQSEDIISPPKGVFIPKSEDFVSPEEDTIPIYELTDHDKNITVMPGGVMVRYAIPFSLYEPFGPPEGYVHDEKDPYVYPNYYVHTNEDYELPDGSKKGWYTIEQAKDWILNELPKIHADFFWDRPRRKYCPDHKKVGTDDEEYWTPEELVKSPAHWLRVNNEGPFIRIFGPDLQKPGFISMRHEDVNQDELIQMIEGLGYKIYADFPLPVPENPDLADVEFADTTEFMGPDVKVAKEQDWSDVRGNCYLRHPDYFELEEHVQFDNYTPAQRWRLRSGLCRDPYRLPPKSEAQQFAEKLAARRAKKDGAKSEQ
eukprot:TRINITY_DN8299_c0_g1_i1.p1 TRINITY_DN8299_c0_g1~~TRINITY_DN8299_c0_g1_i1.p1  ORF type:complete len:325 (+),score=70.76 TRINITY_DN8299_c0_g1_i1:202-1176(+)